MARHFAWNPVDSIPPEINALVDSIAGDLIGSLHRARDHLVDPARHKLPAGKTSLEHRLAASLKKMAPRLLPVKPKASPPSKKKPGPRRAAPRKQRQEVMAALERIMAGDYSLLAQPTPRVIVAPALKINSLECVQDSAEPGKDEIKIGAVATTTRVLANGTLSVDSRIIDPIDFGKFKKDDLNPFNPAKLIAAFETDTPAAVTVHLVLFEDDLFGGIKPVLKDLVDGLENRLNGKQLTAIFASAAELVAIVPIGIALAGGQILAMVIGFIVVSAVVVLAAAVVAALLLALIQLFRDEIFPTQATSLSLGADGAVDAGSVEPFTKRFSRQVAVYDGAFQWQA